MERGAKKKKNIPKEPRTVLRECFKKSSLQSLVPFDIWKVIVAYTVLRTIGNVAQLSRGFRELVRQLRRSDIRMALGYRKAGQIPLARYCITICAEHGNAHAMLLLGIAFSYGGWGYDKDKERRHYWLKKAAEAGDAIGMSLFAHHLNRNASHDDAIEWAKKALSSKNKTAIAICQFYSVGTSVDDSTTSTFLKIAARNDDEIAQYWLGVYREDEGDYESAFWWYLQAAKQGFAQAQYAVYYLYEEAYQYEGIPSAVEWNRKAMQQCCYSHRAYY